MFSYVIFASDALKKKNTWIVICWHMFGKRNKNITHNVSMFWNPGSAQLLVETKGHYHLTSFPKYLSGYKPDNALLFSHPPTTHNLLLLSSHQYNYC